MVFLNSNNIGVFPTTGRPQHDPLGRLTTEYNLTSILNNLLGVDAFVITDPGSTQDGEENPIYNPSTGESQNEIEFKFNIKGYVFTIYDLKALIDNNFNNNSENIYANLKINRDSLQASNDNKNLQLIQSINGGDEVSGYLGDNKTPIYKYKGVEFTDEPNTMYNYSLKILEKRGGSGNWYIPYESKIKFLTNKAGNRRDISIDDGEL